MEDVPQRRPLHRKLLIAAMVLALLTPQCCCCYASSGGSLSFPPALSPGFERLLAAALR